MMSSEDQQPLHYYAPEQVCKKIHPQKYLSDYLQRGVRPCDNRKLFSYRQFIGNVNVLKNCCGSSMVKIGNTTVICGIKQEVTKPSKVSQNKGLVDINCKLCDHCNVPLNHKIRVVQYKNCINLLQRLFIGLKIIDLESLCIAKGELAWLLRVHVLCLDYDGAFWDAAVLAVYLALKSTRLPEIQYNFDSKAFEVDEKKLLSLPVQDFPLSTTFAVFREFVFADPSFEEEQLSTSFIVIVTQNEDIKMLQKRGGSKISDEQLLECVNVSKTRYKIMVDIVKQIMSKIDN